MWMAFCGGHAARNAPGRRHFEDHQPAVENEQSAREPFPYHGVRSFDSTGRKVPIIMKTSRIQ